MAGVDEAKVDNPDPADPALIPAPLQGAARPVILTPFAQAAARLRVGDVSAIEHGLMAAGGTVTITACAFALYRGGVLVSSQAEVTVNSAPVNEGQLDDPDPANPSQRPASPSGGKPASASGFETAAGATATVWQLLDTSALAPGFYTGIFTTAVSDSNGNAQTMALEVLIRIAP